MDTQIKIDLADLLSLTEKPPLYTGGTHVFWQDTHIAAQLLQAHLDPASDTASKQHETIDAEVRFISETLGFTRSHSILDLGCGPGLYCERFARFCGHVTGVDFSRNSLGYAAASAREKGLPITYTPMNYLELGAVSAYDMACMINYDFGALYEEDMHRLLDTVYRGLKPGGFFIFDVFTPAHRDDAPPVNWHVAEGGFWRSGPYLVLEKRYRYPEANARLDQYIVITRDGHAVYRIYDTAFTDKGIETLLAPHGFAVAHIYSDLCGAPLTDDTQTLGIFAQRIG